MIDQSTISKGEVKWANQMKVHRMLYRALDITVNQEDIFDVLYQPD